MICGWVAALLAVWSKQSFKNTSREADLPNKKCPNTIQLFLTVKYFFFVWQFSKLILDIKCKDVCSHSCCCCFCWPMGLNYNSWLTIFWALAFICASSSLTTRQVPQLSQNPNETHLDPYCYWVQNPRKTAISLLSVIVSSGDPPLMLFMSLLRKVKYTMWTTSSGDKVQVNRMPRD